MNRIQVQATNDACTVSKCSAAKLNYFEDEFIEDFVDKKKRRAPLIHLGYYTRAVIMNHLVQSFIKFLHNNNILKFQIISCGSGFDTTYWRLSKENLLNENSIFIEIDFAAVIRKKLELINNSQKLKSYLKMGNEKQVPGAHQLNCNYFLLEADLSDINFVNKLMDNIGIDYDIPTLFLSECAITYMEDFRSNDLIRWMSTKFTNSEFINYEQIHPEDGFGRVMLQHFNKLQSPLFSVNNYSNLKSHLNRYKLLDYQNVCAISEWDAFVCITSEKERKTAFSLELFDEFEEFHMKCIHYVVAISGNRIASNWINSLPLLNVNFKNETKIETSATINVNRFECDVHLYRHSSCSFNNSVYIFGGCDWLSRSSKIYQIRIQRPLGDLKAEVVECIKDDSVQLDVVHGSLTHFELNKVHYICLFGGRNSPDKICNEGSAIIFEAAEGKFRQRLVTRCGNPPQRYRASMTALNLTGNEVHCWMFGGRSADLNVSLPELWELVLRYDKVQNLTYEWKKHESSAKNWPCSRMSHSSTACPQKMAVFISGGLQPDSFNALNDLWEWSCETQSWKELKLTPKFSPVYGHTSHLVGQYLYLVGGINLEEGHPPGLTKIDLVNLTVIEYALNVNYPEPVLLFNHSSEVLEEEGEILIIGGGGYCFSFGIHLNDGVFCLRLNQT